jgi:nicotinamide-nucleotide adenylyltransferase
MWEDTKLEIRMDACFLPMRTQPVHKGHVQLLETICDTYRDVTIGIGSANKYDAKNPYFGIEREMMLRYDLAQMYANGLVSANVKFVQVPDFASDDDWVGYLKTSGALKKGATVISGNEWVAQILGRDYAVQNPFEIVSEPIDICATQVREMIVNGDERWREYASLGTQHYFEQFGGRERISRWYTRAGDE